MAKETPILDPRKKETLSIEEFILHRADLFRLTRGILSGYRTINNLRFLQSDVAILPGNSGGALLEKAGQVIGITVAGLGAKGLAGMNFFIPIEDALSKLSLQVKPK